MTLEDMEPITGSTSDIDYSVSVEQLKIDEQEVEEIFSKIFPTKDKFDFIEAAKNLSGKSSNPKFIIPESFKVSLERYL